MEDGKRKIWLCLLILVLAAVVAGLAWYLSDAQAPSGEGFLIERQAEEGEGFLIGRQAALGERFLIGQQAEEGVVCRVI